VQVNRSLDVAPEGIKLRDLEYVQELCLYLERKLPDLNTYKLEKAIEIIKGTARNMGVEVVET